MCRGLAVIIGKDGKVYCEGINSHSETIKKTRFQEDDCLKYEIIVDENNKLGYSIEVDEDYENNSIIGKEAKANIKTIKEWVKNNELKVLKWLLFNQSHKKVKGDCDNSHQDVKRNCYNNNQKVKGNCYNSNQEVKGNCDNSYQKVEGFCCNINQEIEGNCYNSHQEVKGFCDNSFQKVEGDIYISSIKNCDKEVDDFIEKLTEEHNHLLTWKVLVKLAIKGYKIGGIKNGKCKR